MARLEPDTFCPLIKNDCIGLQCSWFTQVRGRHPQTGADVDEWACAIAWTPILLINTAQEVRQGAAATESLRNKIVETAETALKTHIALAGLQSKKTALAAPGTSAASIPDQRGSDATNC